MEAYNTRNDLEKTNTDTYLNDSIVHESIKAYRNVDRCKTGEKILKKTIETDIKHLRLPIGQLKVSVKDKNETADKKANLIVNPRNTSHIAAFVPQFK